MGQRGEKADRQNFRWENMGSDANIIESRHCLSFFLLLLSESLSYIS